MGKLHIIRDDGQVKVGTKLYTIPQGTDEALLQRSVAQMKNYKGWKATPHIIGRSK